MGLVETIIIYFIVGFIQDLLLTWNTIAIIEKRPIASGLLAIVNTIIASAIWYFLLPTEALIFWINGLSYAVGGGFGVGLIIWYKKRWKYT